MWCQQEKIDSVGHWFSKALFFNQHSSLLELCTMLQMAFGWTHFVSPSRSLVSKLSAQIAEPCVLCQRRGKQHIPFVRVDSLCQTLSHWFSMFFCLDPYEFSCVDASSPCSDNHIAFFSLTAYTWLWSLQTTFWKFVSQTIWTLTVSLHFFFF